MDSGLKQIQSINQLLGEQSEMQLSNHRKLR